MAQTYKIPGRKNRGNISSFRVLSPNKGLNNLVPDTDIDDLESPECSDVDYVERGNPGTRKGYVALGTIDPDGSADGLFEYYKGNGTKFLLVISGTSLKMINQSTWGLTPITGQTFTADKITTKTQAYDSIYFHNGADSMRKFDGTTLSAPSTGIIASYGMLYKGYHILAGNPSFPSRVYYSTVLNPDDFTVGTVNDPKGGWIDVDADDGDRITGIGLWSDSIIVFKERASYQMSVNAATPILSVKPIIKGLGCVSHRSIQVVDNDLYYLSRKGVYVMGNEPNLGSAIRTNELSARIRKTIDAIVPVNFQRCHAIYYDFKYMLCIPMGGTQENTHMIIYDKKFMCWSLWTNQPFNSMTAFIDSTNTEFLMGVSVNDGKKFKLLTGYNDDGVAIPSIWRSKRYNLKTFDEFKRWFDASLLFRSVTGRLSLKIILDGYTVARDVYVGSISSSTSGIGVGEWGLVTVGKDGALVTTSSQETITDAVKRLKINRPARSIQVEVSTNGLNDRFVITGYNVTYYSYGHFKFPSADKI